MWEKISKRTPHATKTKSRRKKREHKKYSLWPWKQITTTAESYTLHLSSSRRQFALEKAQRQHKFITNCQQACPQTGAAVNTVKETGSNMSISSVTGSTKFEPPMTQVDLWTKPEATESLLLNKFTGKTKFFFEVYPPNPVCFWSLPVTPNAQLLHPPNKPGLKPLDHPNNHSCFSVC